MLTLSKSKSLFLQAKNLMPGGVNSPVRGYGAVGGEPVFIKKAQGAYVWDEDGNSYCDYVGSWGPAILGHAHPEVLEAVWESAKNGLSFGAPTHLESKLAAEIMTALPSIESLRLVSSGTEACMSAIRVARGYTNRRKIVKFIGNYHGHGDMLLIKAGSGLATFSSPDSAGVPEGAVKDSLLIPYNDEERLKEVFTQYAGEIAAVIVEPIVGNAGFIRPKEGFLALIRDLCTKNGSLFIFDEVMTGFRVAYGGAQILFDIDPDITVLGKVIGGGMPLAAYGGKKDIMACVAPMGPVYQAGTLSGNPVASACGLKTLQLLSQNGFYEKLSALTESLCSGLQNLGRKLGIPIQTDFEGGMFGMYFSEQPVLNFEDARNSQVHKFPPYFQGMLQEGVYLAPSPYEAGFVSAAHTRQDIEKTLVSAEKVLVNLREQ